MLHFVLNVIQSQNFSRLSKMLSVSSEKSKTLSTAFTRRDGAKNTQDSLSVCPSRKAKLYLQSLRGPWASEARSSRTTSVRTLFQGVISTDFPSQPEMAEKEKNTAFTNKVTEKDDQVTKMR